MQHELSLFIFRQDLRIHDNHGLAKAFSESKKVLPIFIVDERARREFGESDPRFGFIKEALEMIDWEMQLQGGRLSVYAGNPAKIVQELTENYPISAIYVNRSYSVGGMSRDAEISQFCQKQGITFHLCDDYLLVEPEKLPPRKVFTPFFNLWNRELEFVLSSKTPDMQGGIFLPEHIKSPAKVINVPNHPYWTIPFGKTRETKDFSEYEATRNFPAIDGSTRFSPYLRFGIFSVREIFAQIGHIEALRKELAWREFWHYILYHFPESRTLEFQVRRRELVWESNLEYKRAIERAETGYPLIDAGLRQLYTTNWMHNRVRMVVASFITKNCRIDWRWGEKLFQKYLIDYDETVNIGNWQWSASVGADPKPVRIFNPLLQSEKFDPEVRYIKHYIPELTNVNPKDIHMLRNLPDRYPKPIVDQKLSAAVAKGMYRLAKF